MTATELLIYGDSARLRRYLPLTVSVPINLMACTDKIKIGLTYFRKLCNFIVFGKCKNKKQKTAHMRNLLSRLTRQRHRSGVCMRTRYVFNDLQYTKNGSQLPMVGSKTPERRLLHHHRHSTTTTTTTHIHFYFIAGLGGGLLLQSTTT